jgi:hypothetical protein
MADAKDEEGEAMTETISKSICWREGIFVIISTHSSRTNVYWYNDS